MLGTVEHRPPMVRTAPPGATAGDVPHGGSAGASPQALVGPAMNTDPGTHRGLRVTDYMPQPGTGYLSKQEWSWLFKQHCKEQMALLDNHLDSNLAVMVLSDTIPLEKPRALVTEVWAAMRQQLEGLEAQQRQDLLYSYSADPAHRRPGYPSFCEPRLPSS